MLSIRTQDRMALVHYNGCFIEKFNDGYSLKTDIIGKDIVSNLGVYDTLERALEVLDEIERHVVGKVIIPTQIYERKDYLEMGTSNPYVEVNETKIEKLPTIYQMPKE